MSETEARNHAPTHMHSISTNYFYCCSAGQQWSGGAWDSRPPPPGPTCVSGTVPIDASSPSTLTLSREVFPFCVQQIKHQEQHSIFRGRRAVKYTEYADNPCTCSAWRLDAPQPSSGRATLVLIQLSLAATIQAPASTCRAPHCSRCLGVISFPPVHPHPPAQPAPLQR
jgi:hypothetical protein